MRRLSPALLLVALAAATSAGGEPVARKTETVVLIVTDGLRWQEVFRGGDPSLMTEKTGGVEDPDALRSLFLRETPEKRREALLPFLWTVVAREGQIWGDQDEGSVARVENCYRFSYPGYNEMLTGAADPRIDRNDFGPNPNVTVFEWLDGLPDLRGRVEVVGSWDVFAAIFHRERSHLGMRVGWDPPFPVNPTSRQALVNEFYRTTTHIWSDMPPDSFLQQALLDSIAAGRPRVLFVGYGETDEWAHEGRYDLVLESAHRVDGFIRQLWDAMQSMPEYRGKTTFLITTDHGRGSGTEGWKHHDWDVDGAENIWIAALGPDTPPVGARRGVGALQSQIAATVAALLGRDWRAANPAAAPPIAGIAAPR